MKQISIPYRITKPPKAVQQARMDNLALVPASFLQQQQARYQTISRNLPKGSVLICAIPHKPRIARILSQVAGFFREKGHVVRVLPYSLLISENSYALCELLTKKENGSTLEFVTNRDKQGVYSRCSRKQRFSRLFLA